MCLLQVSSLSFIHKGDDAVKLLQYVGNPIVEGSFGVDVICHGIFGGLHRIAFIETRELLSSSGNILPSNTNLPTFCRVLVLLLPFVVNKILF